jgi:hemerythrin-like domain-containing protein
MARRHPGLIGLSHDHHHGLALALRLRQGDNALLNDGWTHDRRAQADVVRRFFENELRGHFAAEEEVLFPLILRHAAESEGVLKDLRQQHRELEAATGRLTAASGLVLEQELVAFGELLERHIRIEERELFPIFERSVPPDAAADAGADLDRERYRTRT